MRGLPPSYTCNRIRLAGNIVRTTDSARQELETITLVHGKVAGQVGIVIVVIGVCENCAFDNTGMFT